MGIARCAPFLLLVACGGGESEWTPLERPATYERDLERSEEAAFAVQADLATTLLEGLRDRDAARLERALAPGLRARFPAPEDGKRVPDAALEVREYGTSGEDAPLLDGPALAARLLEHVAGWSTLPRRELELDRFWLEGGRAVGRFELRVGGEAEDGSRGDLRVTCRCELVRDGGRWRLSALEAVGGARLEGPPPRFVDVTHEVGLHYGISARNRELLTEFADRHQTLALGGLSAVDWNDDGFPDLLGTRRGQLALLFENDGAGGFVPRPLPMREPRQCGSFLLLVDLDGDGREELVGTEPLGFEGERGWCGIWRRGPEGWTLDERALTFPNPRGLRRLAVQSVVPCDVQGDGRLDLFLAVYGSARSRGSEYNTVEAHDGADNHLFVQQPDGSFREESEERGITGTQYTYVAQAFDFDQDGDVDLFEGNDFGPNVLWRNDGAGRFHADDELGFGGVPAYTMGVALVDLEGGGPWSLYISNMSSEEGQRIVPVARHLDERMRDVVGTIASGNQLYTRDPATGRWVERAEELGVAECEWAWGCVFLDAENDGDPDLCVTNGFTSHSDPTRPDWQSWYWRQVVADAGFLARGERSGNVNEGVSLASSFNGYERDRLFHRTDAGTRFHEAGWLYGLDSDHDGRCVVALDVDGDGDQDLARWTLQGLLLHENRGQAGSFLRVALRATGGHPAALGAVVEVRAGDRTRRAVARATEGFQTQVPADLHFGLGDAVRVDEVRVHWPSGRVDTWRDVPAGGRVVLTEADRRASVEPLPAWPRDARPRADSRPALAALLEEARGDAADDDDGVTVVRVGGPAPELRELREARPEVAFLHLPPAGREEATFVFDAEGRPRRSFRRPVALRELAAVLDVLAEEPPFPELLVMSARLALDEGRLRLARQRFARALELDPRRADACEGLGRCHMILGRPDLAEPAYARAVDIDPDYALGHYNLGVARLKLGRPAEALAPLRTSLEITGGRRPALMALAEAGLLAGRHEVALDAWDRAADLDPEDVEPRLQRAKLLGQLGRLNEAAEAFRGVLALRPEHVEARLGLRRVEQLQGRAGER